MPETVTMLCMTLAALAGLAALVYIGREP